MANRAITHRVATYTGTARPSSGRAKLATMQVNVTIRAPGGVTSHSYSLPEGSELRGPGAALPYVTAAVRERWGLGAFVGVDSTNPGVSRNRVVVSPPGLSGIVKPLRAGEWLLELGGAQ